MFGMKAKKKSYFHSAMDYFREDLEDDGTALAFLYVSDDMDWGRKNIKHKGHKDLFFVGMHFLKFAIPCGLDLRFYCFKSHISIFT